MKPILIEEIKSVLHPELKTPLVKGLISGITLDSRQVKPADAFVAVRGKQFDGHDFVEAAVKAGAKLLIVEKNIPPSDAMRKNNVCVMKVPHTITALGDLARFYRRSLRSIVVIAVTGSNGKTTVREMIYHVLSKYKKGHRSPHNYNNQIGVPLTIFGLEPDHDFAVVEIATNAPGEIAALSRIVEPDIAVITIVGQSHLEGLGDIEGVSVEKVSIVSGLKEHGVIICGCDHKPTLDRVRALGRRMITFGLDEKCDVSGCNIRRENGCMIFETSDHIEVSLPVGGMHNVKNALAALAVVRRLGITNRQFAQAIGDFAPIPHRMVYRRVGTITIIDDCYNANPVSMAAALAELADHQDASRRIFVCGDMYELGSRSKMYHWQLGQAVKDAHVDLLLTVGPQAAWTASAALEAGLGRAAVQRSISSRRLARLIKSLIQDGDVVLVKGSRAMQLEKVVESLARWKHRP